jgi:hypothetical protein
LKRLYCVFNRGGSNTQRYTVEKSTQMSFFFPQKFLSFKMNVNCHSLVIINPIYQKKKVKILFVVEKEKVVNPHLFVQQKKKFLALFYFEPKKATTLPVQLFFLIEKTFQKENICFNSFFFCCCVCLEEFLRQKRLIKPWRAGCETSVALTKKT